MMKTMTFALSLSLLQFLHSLCFAQDSACVIQWNDNFQLSPLDTTEGSRPSVAVQGDTAHFTWYPQYSPLLVPYRRSTDGGVTYEPIQELAQVEPGYSAGAGNLLASSSTVYVFYASSKNDTDSHWWLRRSFDRGTTWQDRQLLSAHPMFVDRKKLRVREDTLTIVVSFLDSSVHGRNVLISTNGGDGWLVAKDSIDGGDVGVVFANGTIHEIHVGYVEGFSHEIHYRRSSDFGTSWSDDMILSTLDNHMGMEPLISAAGKGNIAVVWRDSKYDCFGMVGCSVLMKTSTDNGYSWSAEQILTDQNWGYAADVKAARNRGFVVWGTDESHAHIEGRLVSTQTADHCGLEAKIDGSLQTSVRAVDPRCEMNSKIVAVTYQELDSVGISAKWHIWARVGRLPFSEMTLTYPFGWNLASLPVSTDSVYTLYQMYSYEGQYLRKDTMMRGAGYWFRGDTSLVYEGSFVALDTVSVRARWNLIGGITKPVDVNVVEAIPPLVIQSPFYRFSGSGYEVADTLMPGYGYWVKMSDDGKLILR